MNQVKNERQRLGARWIVRVSQDDVEQLQRLCQRHGLKQSALLRLAIRTGLEHIEQTDGLKIA